MAREHKPNKLIHLVCGMAIITLFAGGLWLLQGTDGDRCSSDTDCRAGMYACLGGRCRASCSSDDDCANGRVCTETIKINQITNSADRDGEKFCAPASRPRAAHSGARGDAETRRRGDAETIACANVK